MSKNMELYNSYIHLDRFGQIRITPLSGCRVRPKRFGQPDSGRVYIPLGIYPSVRIRKGAGGRPRPEKSRKI